VLSVVGDCLFLCLLPVLLAVVYKLNCLIIVLLCHYGDVPIKFTELFSLSEFAPDTKTVIPGIV
jgi:hypothetical protein